MTKWINSMTIIKIKRSVPTCWKLTLKKTLSRLDNSKICAQLNHLNQIRCSDIFISSYPKSGNTWVRFLIANMLCENEDVSFRNIEKIVPDIHKSLDIINDLSSNRIIKTHYPLSKCYPQMIYIFRDGRDVMVSQYHYEIQNGRFEGSFAEFLRDPPINSFGTWHEHVEQALEYNNKFPDRVLLLQYEDLLTDPLNISREISRFCEFNVSDKTIAKAVEKSTLNSLREKEIIHGGEYGVENKSFFRSGSAEQWTEYFSSQDLIYFLSFAEPALKALKYM